MIKAPGDNVWAVTIVGQANGLITISFVQTPLVIAAAVRQALEQKGQVRTE